MLYLASVVDGINSFIVIFVFLSVAILGVIIIFLITNDYDTDEQSVIYAKKLIKYPVIGGLIMLISSIFIPNSQTIYLMAANSKAQEFSNTQIGKVAQQVLLSELNKIINSNGSK